MLLKFEVEPRLYSVSLTSMNCTAAMQIAQLFASSLASIPPVASSTISIRAVDVAFLSSNYVDFFNRRRIVTRV